MYLPPKCTAKHQPLDLGLIATSKIRYRSSLLSATLDVLQGRRLSNHGIQSTTGRGKWGLEEGQLPHIGDAMKLFNQSWSSISKTSIMKCWIKSECLGTMHVMHLNSMLTSSAEDSTVDIDLTLNNPVQIGVNEDIIGRKDLQDIREGLLQHKYLTNHPQTPLDEILDNVSNIESESELLDILSSPAPFDKETSRPEVTNEALLDMFKASTVESYSEDATNNVSDSQIDPVSNNEKWVEYTKMTQTLLKVTSDPGMVDLLKKVERHGQEIASQSQSE